METKLLCVSIRLLCPVYFNLKNFITQSCQLNFVFDLQFSGIKYRLQQKDHYTHKVQWSFGF